MAFSYLCRDKKSANASTMWNRGYLEQWEDHAIQLHLKYTSGIECLCFQHKQIEYGGDQGSRPSPADA